MGKSKYYTPKQTPLEIYRKRRLKSLSRDFCIKLTEEEERHAKTLTTETQIDQFCLGMMNKKWGVKEMHPRCNFDFDNCATQTKKYQLVIMMEDGYTSFSGRLYSWNEIGEAMREMRELYAKHGVTHHVGYREV